MWSVAVFSHNERDTIVPCLKAIKNELGDHPSRVTIVINGCTDGSRDVLASFLDEAADWLDAWEIPFGDKSNAWNQFVHAVRPAADTYFFVDAYATVQPGAFRALDEALKAAPQSPAASGVPSVGRSAKSYAKQQHAERGLHGSLHALRATFLDRIKERGIRIPLGLYRGDGLIGAMAAFDLDAVNNEWTPERVEVVDAATWIFRPLSPYRLGDLKRQYRRQINQARGRLENRAITASIKKIGFEGLGEKRAEELMYEWIEEDPAERRPTFWGDFFGHLALRRPRTSPPDPATLLAKRIEPLGKKA